MKPQIIFYVAIGGSVVTALLAAIDPLISNRDAFCAIIGIWAFVAGSFVVELLTTNPNEKDNP